MPRSILILGATSAIAQFITLELAGEGDHLVLAARDQTELKIIANNVRARRLANVQTVFFDARAIDGHAEFYQSVVTAIGTPDLVVVATGALGDQIEARTDVDAITDIVASNFLGIATGLAEIVNDMEKCGNGHLILLSSVAGDRGRASNYTYGSAKAGINAYFSGLRARLHKSSVHVTTVKLGFTDTQMVFGMSGTFLVADPSWVAKKIGELTKKPRDVMYLPGFWRYILTVIRLLPETIFKRLPL